MFENLINFFKLNTKKVKDFFSVKPKTYLLGNGQELDLGGEINQRSLYSFFANFGDKLVKYTEKAKQKAHLSKINNQPLEYSTALTEVKKSKTVENKAYILIFRMRSIEFVLYCVLYSILFLSVV